MQEQHVPVGMRNRHGNAIGAHIAGIEAYGFGTGGRPRRQRYHLAQLLPRLLRRPVAASLEEIACSETDELRAQTHERNPSLDALQARRLR